MSIAHVVDEGAWGGLATFMFNLLSSQRVDAQTGRLHLVCDPERADPSLLGMAGVEYHAYRSDRSLKRAPATARAIHAHLERIRPDIVVLHSSFPGLWGRLRGGRTWKTLYCAHGWSFQQRISSLKRSAYMFVEAALSRRTDAIVSISASEYDAAERAAVRPSIHRLIRHGLMPAGAEPGPALPLQAGKINLLFVGRFDRQKGLDILLEALDDPRLAHVVLWVVGRNIIGKGVTVPERPNIRLLGWMDNDRIDGVIRQMDAVVVPSRWEGFGLIALEAMRNRRPPIVSRLGGLRELVVDGVNGLFLDIGSIEAVRSCLAGLEKERLHRMGETAYAVFEEKHRWERCYGEWRALLAELGGKAA